MAGTGKGAEKGMLFKDSKALETATSLDTIVLDKTGTITMGKPSVVDITILDHQIHGEDELLRIAASVERGSEHPIGRAIVKEAEDRGIVMSEPEAFKATSGLGVYARIGGDDVRVGRPEWIAKMGIDMAIARERIDSWQDEGKTVMAVAIGEKITGLISVSDTVKSGSAEAIKELHGQGLKVVMITGDNAQTARTIAKEVGVDDIVAEVLPEEKAERIKALQDQGRRVGMVGDGINDAPALAQADVGMAIGTGTDVAIESGDVILASGRLGGIPMVIRLSRATMRTIRQNLFWAFFYNIVLIPVAAGALYPFEALPWFLRQLHPILAALAMAMSSITVVSNSLRLYRAKIE